MKTIPNRALRRVLAVIESAVYIKPFITTKPQVFILGLPRSGTTLIYQYLVSRCQVAYFTNGVGNFPKSPCLISYLQHKLYGNYSSDFESHYGKVRGATAPREAGSFWGRYFDLDLYTEYRSLTPQQIQSLQNTIYCLQVLFGDLPFVNKNVKHILRIEALEKIFPNSYFIVVNRDLHQVALSILRGRYTLLDDPTEWWSVKPPDFEMLYKQPIIEQVAGQVVGLKKRIESDFSKIVSSRIISISYEDFCANPELLLEKIQAIYPKIKLQNKAVSQFNIATNHPETQAEENLVQLIQQRLADQ